MTKSTITRERLQEIAEDGFLKHGESKELARMALAALDSEPVFTLQVSQADYKGQKLGNHFWFITLDAARELDEGNYQLYRHAQQPVVRPAPECQHQWRHGGANKLQNQKQCIKCGRVELDAQQPVVQDERAAFNAWNNDVDCHLAGRDAKSAAWLAWQARAKLVGNSPVIPEGYVMVPMRLTAENGAKGALSGEFSETKFVNCPECFGDDECETCDGSGRIEIKVPVSWTTIKEIWIKGVEHFAAAPQENN